MAVTRQKLEYAGSVAESSTTTSVCCCAWGFCAAGRRFLFLCRSFQAPKFFETAAPLASTETRNGGWEATAFSLFLVRLLFQRIIAGNASRWRYATNGDQSRFADVAESERGPARLAATQLAAAKPDHKRITSSTQMFVGSRDDPICE